MKLNLYAFLTSLNFDIVGFELGYIFALQKCDFIYNVNFNVERKAGPPFVFIHNNHFN